MIEIENLSLDEWLSGLKPYQRNAIKQLINTYGEEKAVKEWLTARGPIHTATFGGDVSSTPNSFVDNLKVQFDRLVCGHPDYKLEQAKVTATAKTLGVGSVSYIATVLASAIGAPVALITPSLLLLFHITAKMSVKAYCATVQFK